MKCYLSVLESKLVFLNGFSISLASEWLENQNGKFDKQDCEQAAFKRLAKTVKTSFPWLAIVVTADALYCSEPVFEYIKEYHWKFTFIFKDDSLKSLWKKINNSTLLTQEQTIKKLPSGKWFIDQFSLINELRYKDQQVNFITYQQCEDQQIVERHVHLTSLTINEKNAQKISKQGILSGNIVNQGFKNRRTMFFFRAQVC